MFSAALNVKLFKEWWLLTGIPIQSIYHSSTEQKLVLKRFKYHSSDSFYIIKLLLLFIFIVLCMNGPARYHTKYCSSQS